MFKTLRKGFLAVVLAVVALFTLASCVIGGTQQPTEDPTNKAQAALNEFTANVTFANAEAVTTSFNLPIAGKKGGFNIPISWSSSNEEVIAVVDLMENGAPSTYYKQAKVTRPAFDKEDATVTLTADFSLTYTKNDGTSATLKAQKTYTFVVVKETSEIASGNLAAIKAAAGKFYFEENGVAAGSSSPKELAFPVEFDATVTAVLGADGAGQFTVSDGSAGIYVYSNKTAVKVGDKVHVKGDITTYYGTLQVGANIEVTVLGASDQTIEFKPATPGEINAMPTADGMFGGQTIKATGTLLFGKYNGGSSDSFWLEDVQTGSQVELYYKSFTAAEKEALQAFAGKFVEIDVVTYDTYASSKPNDHRVFAIPSTCKEATAPEVTDADKLAAAVNKVKAVQLAALYVDGQEFAFPAVDGGEGVTITWAIDPAAVLVDGKLVVAENGTAKLVATVKVAELSETVELTINLAKEAKEEPVVTNKTVAELIALTTEMDAKYTVSGKVVKWGNKLDSTDTAATMYGNFILEDAEGKQIIVYGATATASALTFDAATGKYTYKNAKDFLTDALTSTIVVGDTVELVVVRTSYNGNPQLNAIVTKVIKGEGGDTPVDPEQPETPVAGVLELTAAKLGLGAYADGSKAVDGVEFSFIELGDYGNGIQMRNKTKASTLWNTTALPGTIKNIVLVYNSAKSVYDNTDALVFTFGNDATLAGGTVKLSTVKGQTTYTVTPDADNYTFFKVAINITYSMYWDSITINYEGGSTTPEAPKHEHVACPTCGKCTAADCDGAAEDKCAGHTTEPEGPVAGSAELPFTATQAAEVTAKLEDKVASTDKYYVTGTVKSITEISTSYGNGTFVITDGTTDFIIFRAKYLENAKFTSTDQLAVGDTVVVYGQLINYGGTLEMNSGCYLTAHTKAETPETPKHDHVVCPECGKCTAADCDGAAEDKCAGHTTEPETPVASSLELTAAKLGLGAYADGTKAVDGVDFGFIELGDYGNGIQMRNKTKPSSLWNATALPKAIKNIVLVYNSAKSTYDNADAFTFLFGTDATVSLGTVKLSTVKGQATYTVTPDAETYTFFKMTLNLTYSFYWDSITINYVDGTSEPVNPDTPHVHTEEVLPAVAALCYKTGLTEGKKCSECGEILVAQEEVPATNEHVDTNLDITCDTEGCTKRILPAADSKISLFTAKHMIIVSLSNSYYAEGVVTEVLDAKNGVFVITDEAGDSILVRLPKNAEGTAYSSWTSGKVVLGDTIQMYGKPTRNTSSTYTQEAKIESGVLTVLKHEHKFSEATCKVPATCECLAVNGEALGHGDTNGDNLCDRCQFNMSWKESYIVIATNPSANGVLAVDESSWTWSNEEFDAVIAKGASTFTIYKSEKAYMQLKKLNTLTVASKNGATIVSVTIYVTNETQLANLANGLAGVEFTKDDANLCLTIQWNKAENFVITNNGTNTAYVSGVNVVYESKAVEEPVLPEGTLLVDPSNANAYATLDEAIAAAQAGNTIKLVAGEYTLSAIINKNLTIVGPNADLAVADFKEEKAVITITKDVAGNLSAEVVFNGVHLKGSGKANNAGVYFQNGGALTATLKSCEISEMNTLFKIQASKPMEQITIENCHIHTIGQFIVWTYANAVTGKVTLVGNYVEGGTCGTIDNNAAALFRVRGGSLEAYNNYFKGDSGNTSGYFEALSDSVVKYNTFDGVTLYVKQDAANKLVFDKNLYLNASGEALTASPITGVTADTTVAKTAEELAKFYEDSLKPHEHTLCEKCGKCTAEDCDGSEKCEGHVVLEKATYSYEFTSSQFSANGTKALNGINWTVAGDGGYWGWDNNNGKGQQFGSSKLPYKTLTVVSDEFTNVSKITIKTSGASSVAAKLNVYVGETLVKTITLTSTSTEYSIELEAATTGAIKFEYVQTSSKALYIKAIGVEYAK